MTEPRRDSLWDELRPGYVYLWRRLTEHRHDDEDDVSETVMLAFFLITFIPWLPFIWLAHFTRKLVRVVLR